MKEHQHPISSAPQIHLAAVGTIIHRGGVRLQGAFRGNRASAPVHHDYGTRTSLGNTPVSLRGIFQRFESELADKALGILRRAGLGLLRPTGILAMAVYAGQTPSAGRAEQK